MPLSGSAGSAAKSPVAAAPLSSAEPGVVPGLTAEGITPGWLA